MNYKTHYENLINRARNRTLDSYTESHHIIPRCLGGTDDKDNLVNLTAREHFIAHLLLWKIHPESYGLIKAIQMMCVGHKDHRSGNRMYGWLKEHHANAMSLSQAGEGNSQFGTMWIHNLDLKESIKIKKDELPNWEQDGWLKGRKIDFSLKYCMCCGSISTKKFCNSKCKMYYRSPHFKIIDENVEEMISYFQVVKSIDKTLKHFGITGSRVGNSYLSAILKNNNIEVLRRRNS